MNVRPKVSDNSDYLSRIENNQDGRGVLYSMGSIGSVESISKQKYSSKSLNHNNVGICTGDTFTSSTLSPNESTSLVSMDFSNGLDGKFNTTTVPSNVCFTSEHMKDRQFNGPIGQTSTSQTSMHCGSCTKQNRFGSNQITPIRVSPKLLIKQSPLNFVDLPEKTSPHKDKFDACDFSHFIKDQLSYNLPLKPDSPSYPSGFNMSTVTDSKVHSETTIPANEETSNNKNDFKTKSTINLNSVNNLEFFEGYRNRNSSQRPLVPDESFSNASTLSVHTGITDNDPASVASEGGLIIVNDLPADDFKDKAPSPDRSNSESLPERGQWSGQLDFIFSCISYAVGLGNVWRFPYLCYKNGGGAFLIPYLICVFTLGIPLFIMEVGLGQFTSSGGISIWNKIPIMKGVGYASMVMIGLCNTYYIIIISWTLYFLFMSFNFNELPWAKCGQEWNNELCFTGESNVTGAETPAAQFWKKNVLNISGDFGDLGSIQWHLLITLIIAWILVLGVIYKGIHQSGKIIWFTAMFPYVILTILFAYGLSLVGSGEGISFYLTPKWEMLENAEIWVAAGTQLLFTYGIGIGTNIALGSYNAFHHNFFRDSLIACILSSCTSLFSGFVIFSVLGHLAYELGIPIDKVVEEGPGLTFVVYPEAVARLPISQLWAILFFIMLLILGIDSQFCTVESFITGLVDEFPKLLRPRRVKFTIFIVIIHFLFGLTMITQGGLYIFQLMDNFSASGVSLLVVVLCEIIGFCWIYGGNNIYRHMETMLGFKPPRVFYYLWVFVSPLILLAILVFSIVRYSPPEISKGKSYPWQGQLLGWIISASSMICIPIYFVYYIFFKTDSTLSLKERLIQGFSDPTNNSVSFESNSNLEESFNCDVEKCSGIDLLNIIQINPNQNHILGKPAPV